MTIVSIITIFVSLLISSAASLSSYDCGSSSRGEPESERYWRGSFKEGVLPCEFKELVDLPSDYNKREPPQNPNHEIRVSIGRVEFMEDGEKCNVTVESRFKWTDQRLKKLAENATSSINSTGWNRVPLSAMYYVWRPSPSIYYYDHSTLDGLHTLDYPGDAGMLEVYLSAGNSSADFLVYYRKSVIIQSTVGYMYYPHDKHEFLLFIGQGFDGKLQSRKKHLDPVTFSHPSFKIHVTTRSHQPDASFSTKKMNHSAVVIVFTRKPQSYLIRTYLPSGLFVFLSWLSMLVPVALATERVALCTATLLTITTFFNTASLLGPEVSYLRASDIWLLGCILFVFIILFENIAVMKITGRLSKKLPKPAGDNPKLEEKAFENIRLLPGSEGSKGTGAHSSEQQETTTAVNKPELGSGNEIDDGIIESDDNLRENFIAAKRMDRVSVFVITSGILICNVIYWIWLLASAQTSCDRDSSNCSDEL